MYKFFMRDKKRYPSDLTDKQWSLIHSFYKSQYNRQGRPPSKNLREIWNGILYITRGGFSWRMLPTDFPPWKTVYHHFNKLKHSGKLEVIMDHLRKKVRLKSGKEESPSVCIVDSQSIKSRSGKKIR